MVDVSNEISKSGLPTVKVSGYYLHSKYDPVKEAGNFVDEKYIQSDVQLLIGYGLGYIYNELKNRLHENERIIVIDPFIESINGPVIDDNIIVFKNQNLDLLIGFLKNNISLLNSINIIISINYENIFKNKLVSVLKALEDFVKSNQIIENTISYHIRQWNINYIKNLKYSKVDNSIEKLFNIYSCPIVVASGGPSLTKQLELLKKFRDKVILIAAGTTINSLLNENITPDYIVSVDGGEVNFQHFMNLKFEDVPLIYCPSLHYGIRNSFKNAYVFLPESEKMLKKHYDSFTDFDTKVILGGSSVANFAYNIALYMTSGPIILIGQDLAYTNGQSHAKGNLNFKKISNTKNYLVRQGYYGDNVFTDDVFIQMRDAFESIVQIEDAYDRSYNCSEGGLKINGFLNVGFETFLTAINTSINKAQELDCYGKKENNIIENFNFTINKIEDVILLLKKAIKLVNKLNVDGEIIFNQSVLNKLENIDEEISKIIAFTNLPFAFNLLNLNLLKYFKFKENMELNEKLMISYEQNKYMYSEMLTISKDILKMLKQELKELEKVNG